MLIYSFCKINSMFDPFNFMQVCDYHAKYYRPDNLCLIITGQVESAEVLKVIFKFEETIVAKVTCCTCIYIFLNE